MDPNYVRKVSTYQSKKELYGVHLEEALNIVGFGKYQWIFSAIGGLAFLAAGVQNGITAFILPSMKCDMGLTNTQMGLLNAFFLIGGIGSGAVWGTIADTLGRKPVLYYGLLADSAVTLGLAFAPNFCVFLVFRFLNGFIIGGPASITLVHVGEFLPQKYRSQVLCYVGLTWAASWVLTAGLSWFIIPLDLSWEWLPGVYFTSWRFLIVVMAVLDLISAILYSTVHESPKFYLSTGRDDLALEVLKKVYAENHGVNPEDYPVKSLELMKTSNAPVDCPNKSICRPIVVTLKQFKALLHGPAFGTTALACLLWFTNMFGYYGLGLWMPELAHRYTKYEASNVTTHVSVCELSELLVEGDAAVCGTVDSSVFVNTLVSGGSLVVGNLIAAMLASKLPRRFMPVFLMFGAAACVMALFLVRTSSQYLLVTSLFQLCIGTANLVQNALVVDIFPPEVSGIAICMAIMIGRVGAMISNIVLGSLLDISCAIPLVMCAVFIAVGGFASFFIPPPYEESTVKPLPVISRSTA